MRRKCDANGCIPSMAQINQRELSWLLYITEGYIANVQRALTVNAYTLEHSTLQLMNKAVENSIKTAEVIHRELRKGSK